MNASTGRDDRERKTRICCRSLRQALTMSRRKDNERSAGYASSPRCTCGAVPGNNNVELTSGEDSWASDAHRDRDVADSFECAAAAARLLPPVDKSQASRRSPSLARQPCQRQIQSS